MRTDIILSAIIIGQTVIILATTALACVAMALVRHQDKALYEKFIPDWARKR